MISVISRSYTGKVNPLTKGKEVIVVGGGLAGLSAATALKERGFYPMVLEARDRLGGRVETKTLRNGQRAEAGGEFIDGQDTHRNLHGLIRKYGLDLEVVRSKMHRFQKGQLSDVKVSDSHLSSRSKQDIARFWNATDQLARGIHRHDPLSSPFAANLDHLSVKEWMDRLHLSKEAKDVITEYFHYEFQDPAQVSLLFHGQQASLYLEAKEEDTEAYRIKGGNQCLLKAMADSLDHPPKLGQKVEKIDAAGDRIKVQYPGGTVEGDYVVVATPLTTLKNIQFNPPLPRAWQEAADQIPYGQHAKAIMSFENPSWQSSPYYNVKTDLPMGWIWDSSRHQPGSEGTLVAYGNRPISSTDAATYKGQVHQVFPEAGNLTQMVVQQWGQDPFSQGSFCSYAPGQMTAYWRSLRNPHGRIFLAGEHTATEFVTYMEGAAESGLRAATQISRVHGERAESRMRARL